jgi:hypothetical protein
MIVTHNEDLCEEPDRQDNVSQGPTVKYLA